MRRRPSTRVHTRTVLQWEAAESGAAALAMILGFYRSFVELHRLRSLCGTGRDGSSVEDLVRAAGRLGLVASPIRTDPMSLDDLTVPCILAWRDRYVVLEGWTRRLGHPKVCLNDPAQGRRRLAPRDFDAGFSGDAVVLVPGPEFQPSGRPPQPLRDLLARLSGVRTLLAIALVTSLLLGLVGTVAASFTKGFIDTFLVTDYSPPVMAFFALMAAVLALIAVLAILQQRYLLRAETWTATRDTARLVRHLLRLPVGFFTQRRPADVAQRLRLNDSVTQVLSRRSTSLLTSAAIVVAYTALLWHFDPVLAMIGVGAALLKVGLARLMVRLRRQAVARSRLARSRLMSTAYSGIQYMETLKATGGELDFFRRWGGHQADLLQEQQRLGVPPLMMTALGSVLTAATTLSVLLVGGLRAIQGHVPIGVLIAFLTVLPSMTKPMEDIVGLFAVAQETAADSGMLRDLETADEDPVFEQSDSGQGSRLGGTVRVEDVTFGYAPLSPPSIRAVSFAVGPGRQVALVGASGSGKSTLAKLLVGLYQPWSGTILVDGKPIETVSRRVRAASIACVDQDVFLFQGSVKDNVTLWDPSVSDELVSEALADACLEDVVAARPGGIHSAVEQDGRNFSGGQRQRLEIARALLRQPSILVLDEATSALDARTEHQISTNLRRRGCACVLVAHRLSTVRDSDEILVLDSGQVIERGTHDELDALGGAYASLIKEEFDGR